MTSPPMSRSAFRTARPFPASGALSHCVNTPAVPPPTFETTNIANKTNVVFSEPVALSVVNGTVNITAASTGLTTLAFELPTGQDDHGPSFVHTPSGVATTYLGNSAADVTSVTGLGVAAGAILSLDGAAGDIR